ncbi:MAG: tetratricopeptide repeat protein, partial [Pirellulales bacterium]|nr:tetratricopeptide repeat protein [Pirellulales bacterium]
MSGWRMFSAHVWHAQNGRGKEHVRTQPLPFTPILGVPHMKYLRSKKLHSKGGTGCLSASGEMRSPKHTYQRATGTLHITFHTLYQSTASLLICIVFLCFPFSVHAQQPPDEPDAIVVAGKSERGTSAGRTTYRGTIEDYTADELTLALPNGAKKRFPIERIVEVHTAHGPMHQQADALYDREDYQAASTLYGKALEQESRRWARRRIIQRMARCYRALGQYVRAGEAFLLLSRDDAHAIDLSCMPLAWTSAAPSADLERAAQ